MHAAEGYDVELACIVHGGDVTSDVSSVYIHKHDAVHVRYQLLTLRLFLRSYHLCQMMWYQNSFLLDQSDRRSMDSKGERYEMLIRNFQSSDFGNYR